MTLETYEKGLKKTGTLYLDRNLNLDFRALGILTRRLYKSTCSLTSIRSDCSHSVDDNR